MSTDCFAVHGVSDAGVVRANNEDAFAVVDVSSNEAIDVSSSHTLIEAGERGLLLVVSDGMGGENAGEVASALAIEAIREALSKDDAPPERALTRAVEQANESVLAAANEPGRRGMGATVVALLLQGAHALTAEVGDSRAYVLRSGTLTQITKDQTYMQVLLERGVIDAAAAKSSQARNVVLQAVGKEAAVVVAMRRLALRRGDRLLLCSDGLSGSVTDDEIRQILASESFLDDAGERLVAMANARGGQDNVTVVIADVASESLPDPSAEEDVLGTVESIRSFTIAAE